MTRAFIIWQKPDGKIDRSEQAVRENCIFYGLPNATDLLDPTYTVQTMAEAIRLTHGRDYVPLREAKMFWLFSREIQAGDLVLVPVKKENKTVFLLARVTGEAYSAPEHRDTHTSYRRPVQWLNDCIPIERHALPVGLEAFRIAPYRVTLACLDVTQFAKEIAGLISAPQSAVLDYAISREDFDGDFKKVLASAHNTDSIQRRQRLAVASKKPNKRAVISYEYIRNPDVVVETLSRAHGICEKCKLPAPFPRKSDGTPYLEVHHIVQLANGGEDTVDNAIALCPNCHRYMHFG